MGVKHEHSEYCDMKKAWARCSIAAAGHYAVQEAGDTILPRLSAQDETEYQSYKRRATFYNATWRTIDGLRGMIFRKAATVVVPDGVKEMLKDINLSGTSLQTMASNLVVEALKLGRAGLWLDYPAVDTANATQADLKQARARPMIKMFDAYSIINWKTRTINNETQLSMVVLKEKHAVAKSEFEDTIVVRYRVLDLDEGLGNKYRVRVFEERANPDGVMEDVLVDGPFYPTIKSKMLDMIPFKFVGVDSTDWTVVTPPLVDLVEINFSHYCVTADYEHGCHFTGLPTAVISGHQPDQGGESKFTIGSMNAWVFTQANAKATYLEFTGQGLQALRDNLEDKKLMMAVLGARMLESEPSAVQSASTAAIHRGGEQSMLASIALNVSQAVEWLLKLFAEQAGFSGTDVKYDLNRDFFPMPMDSLMMTAIIAAWQNGAIDFPTMVENLKRGEIIPMDMDPEVLRKEIEKNPPPAQDVPTTPGDRAGNGPNQGAAKGVSVANPTQTQLQNK